jgi:hypothetical protein
MCRKYKDNKSKNNKGIVDLLGAGREGSGWGRSEKG